MPELPEVETIVSELKNELKNKKILNVHVFHEKIYQSCKNRASFAIIIKQSITDVFRKGKYIVVELKNKAILIFHLRMTGHLYFKSESEKNEKHEHLHFILDDKRKLVFYDPRRFGRCYIDNSLDFFNTLGKDPTQPEFNKSWLLEKLKANKRQIKAFLLDQKIIAGIGNIYANEILWEAAIHPQKRSDTLSEDVAAKLYFAMVSILKKAIEKRGTSLGAGKGNYFSASKKKGLFQNYLKVHQKEHEACPRCQTAITRIITAQRASFICPKCQSALAI